MLEKPLEKKAGRNYGPPGTKRLIYFIDDMNMPEVDQYFTVQPHTLIRQHLDYSHWYDRHKLTLKEVHNTQYVSCMNPTAGSFTINSRLQRHFCVFALSFPGVDALQTIYSQILSQHLAGNGFAQQVQKVAGNLTSCALSLHSRVSSNFLPTAIKFHYIFNLRDLSNIFQVSNTLLFAVTIDTISIRFCNVWELFCQGILFSVQETCKTPLDLVRLWMHEANRVYRDKLVDAKDMENYDKLVKDVTKKSFEASQYFCKSHYC